MIPTNRYITKQTAYWNNESSGKKNVFKSQDSKGIIPPINYRNIMSCFHFQDIITFL